MTNVTITNSTFSGNATKGIYAERLDNAVLDGVTVDVATDNSLVTLAFNTTKKPWDDANVRKAVAHCIDRSAIVSSLLKGAEAAWARQGGFSGSA